MPRQLANRTQAHPLPINLSSTPDVRGHYIRYYPRVGTAIPGQGADCLRVTHPFAAMHCCTARLACIRHATSVRSEPGSNSSFIFQSLGPVNHVRIFDFPRILLYSSLSTSPIPSIYSASSRVAVPRSRLTWFFAFSVSFSAVPLRNDANYRIFRNFCQGIFAEKIAFFFLFSQKTGKQRVFRRKNTKEFTNYSHKNFGHSNFSAKNQGYYAR